MQKIFFSILILSFLTIGLRVLAQDNDLPSPGLTPDSPFYFSDTLAEKISLFFTFDTVKKAEKAMQYAGEKLAEARTMAGANKIGALKKAGQKYQEYLALFFKKGGETYEAGKDVAELEERSKRRSLDYLRVLADTQEEASAEAKTEVEKIIKVSRKSFGETIWGLHEEKMKQLQEERRKEKIQEEIEILKKEGIKVPEETVKVETADWKIYINEKYGYSFKYPKGVKLVERDGGDCIELGEREEVKGWPDIGILHYDTSYYNPPEDAEFIDWVKKYFVGTEGVIKEEFEFKGAPAVKIYLRGANSDTEGDILNWRDWAAEKICYFKDRKIFLIDMLDVDSQDGKEFYDLFLSTFKFIK